MPKVLSYDQVVREIDNNIDLLFLSDTEKKEWEQVIQGHIHPLEQKEDENDDLAAAYLYSLFFQIKTNLITDQKIIEQKYMNIKKLFLHEEKMFHSRLKSAENTKQKRMLVHHMSYFYKMVEFYLTYLEKTLLFHSMEDTAQMVYQDKIYFLQKHQLLEHNIKKFFSYLHLSFKLSLKKFIFLYAFLGGMAVVLFWHGVWGITDWVIAQITTDDTLTPYIVTTVLGSLLMFGLGLFLDQLVGDKSSPISLDDMKQHELEELTSLEKEEHISDKNMSL